MRITRQIASPAGLLAYRPELGEVVVEGCDGLTYAAYFHGLESFVRAEALPALAAAAARAGGPEDAAGIDELVLRAEKHGALYHPASVTVRFAGGEAKLCVNVAATPAAAAMLEQEAGLLTGLRQGFTPEYLPCPHAWGTVGGLTFLLEDWFAGFHEFHQDGSGQVRLWDYDAGERVLEARAALEIYRQAALILTRYYHVATGAGIGPWHHAAGDFVARVVDGQVAVRLITVRGYGAGRDFSEAGPLAGKLSALAFFTNLTMRIRLDRVDGVGDLVLAGEDVAEAAVAGFARGLAEVCGQDGTARDILAFLASFAPQELARSGLELAWPCPEDEAALLAAAWPGHGAAVAAALGKILGE